MQLKDWAFSDKWKYGVSGHNRDIDELKFDTECSVDMSWFIPVGVFSVPKNYCPHFNEFNGQTLDVILTANEVKEHDGTYRINYSCQCACGAWCTSGHSTPGAAVDEYMRMCERAEWEEYMIEKYGMNWDINNDIEIDEKDIKAKPIV